MYILENKKEAQRLETQSQVKQYSVVDELSKINFPSKGSVLDSGCGTGLLAGKVKKMFKHLDVDGCDLSSERIQFAKDNYENINFYEHDLIENKFSTKYDLIINRYVAHHVGENSFSKILHNLREALNPGGQIAVIDIENIIVGLGTTNPWLENKLHQVKSKFSGDLMVGRKIPKMLSEVGFQNVHYHVEAMFFEGESLKKEIEQIKSRIEFAREFFVEVVGQKDFRKFYDLYMEELNSCAFFYNKLIIQGER